MMPETENIQPRKTTKAGQRPPAKTTAAATHKIQAKAASQQPANLDRDDKTNPQKKQVETTTAFSPPPTYSPDTVAQHAQNQTAQRYGKGRAANES